MRSITANRQVGRRRIGLRSCSWLLLALVATPAVRAAPPIDPLPVPEYSFGLASWTVRVGIVDARDVLTLDSPYPDVLVPGALLWLDSPTDDIDALSTDNAFVGPQDTFALLFSVDPNSLGAAPPDPELIELHVPFNVAHQARLSHAAGDQFMSIHLFTQLGGLGGSLSNNVLTRNNYDEGGTDFSAQPPASAHENAVGQFLDIVNAMAQLTHGYPGVVNVYFSVTSDSPSLEWLPSYGLPSGADIYVNEAPLSYAPTVLYAAHEFLQLARADDIDALIVFDTNENQIYDGSDRVLFSLAPGSPSLTTIPGASKKGAAADVFTVAPGQGPELFAAAADLGLGNPRDNLDALDFFFCDDALFCAARHGIRGLWGDLDGDGEVDLADLSQLLANYGTTSGATYEDGDLDHDGDVDVSDLTVLLRAYGTTLK